LKSFTSKIFELSFKSLKEFNIVFGLVVLFVQEFKLIIEIKNHWAVLLIFFYSRLNCGDFLSGELLVECGKNGGFASPHFDFGKSCWTFWFLGLYLRDCLNNDIFPIFLN